MEGNTLRNLDDLLMASIAAGMVKAAEKVTEAIQDNYSMRDVEGPGGSTERTYDSIGFAMRASNQTYPGVPRAPSHTHDTAHYESDKIKVPDQEFSFSVGVGVPYAGYIEHGSGPHSSSGKGVDVNGGTFVEKMKDWGRRRGMDDEHIYRIIKKIREHGVDANPFMPTEEELADIAEREINENLSTILTRVFSKNIEVEVNITK